MSTPGGWASGGAVTAAQAPARQRHQLDAFNRAVWKVTLATPNGRVVADIDKQTGTATIVGPSRSGDGNDDGVPATTPSPSDDNGDRQEHGDQHDG
jgi:hypothetical protein